MLLQRVVTTSAAVSGSASRLAKIAEIAALLRDVPASEIPIAVAFLSGELTQRQIGVGYAAIVDLLGPPGGRAAGPAGGHVAGPAGESLPASLPPAPSDPTLTLSEADEAFGAIGV